MSELKTNAMRILDAMRVSYQLHTYEPGESVDGVSVATKMGMDVNKVYKTLVTQGKGGGFFVFVIPVARELDLKKAARAAGEKSVEMIPVKEINRHTGYIRGGCSPVGGRCPPWWSAADESGFRWKLLRKTWPGRWARILPIFCVRNGGRLDEV